jgi:hypothetical protein
VFFFIKALWFHPPKTKQATTQKTRKTKKHKAKTKTKTTKEKQTDTTDRHVITVN